MKTRDEFVDQWKNLLAGLALFGYYGDRMQGPMERGDFALKLPEKVVKLLSQMYDSIGIPERQPKKESNATHVTNGRADSSPASQPGQEKAQDPARPGTPRRQQG